MNIAHFYTDVGSGLNTNRKGLWRLLRDAKKGIFSTVVLNFKERLTRFGYAYIEHYLAEYGVKLLCINKLDEKTPESELVEDLVAIVHPLTFKYSLRFLLLIYYR